MAIELAPLPDWAEQSRPDIVMAVIYVRVSKDKKKGRSVEEQEQMLREVARQNGWPVYERVFVDNDIGASWRSKGYRKDWAELPNHLQQGWVLLVFADNRANRNVTNYAKLRELCMEKGSYFWYGGRLYDMRVGRDRVDSAQDAVKSEAFVEDLTAAIQRSINANLMAGRGHGILPYGYRKVRDDRGEPTTRTWDEGDGRLIQRELDPKEAPIAEEIFRRFVDNNGEGEGAVSRIWKDLHGRGIRGRYGGELVGAQIHTMLRNASYAGYRTHKGKPVRLAAWPPLIDEETFVAAQEILDRTERKSYYRGKEPRHLLTGAARCWAESAEGKVCGQPMKRRGREGTAKPEVYYCNAKNKEIRHVTRNAPFVDELVEETLFYGLSDPEMAENLAKAMTDSSARQEKRAKLLAEAKEKEEYLQGYLDLAMDPKSAMPPKFISDLTAKLQPDIDDLYRRAAQLNDYEEPKILKLLLADDPRAVWKGEDIKWRRALIKETFDIRILPIPPERRSPWLGKDPDYVDIRWAV